MAAVAADVRRSAARRLRCSARANSGAAGVGATDGAGPRHVSGRAVSSPIRMGSTSSIAVKSSMNVSAAKRRSEGALNARRTVGSAALVSAGQIGDAAVHWTGCSMPHQIFPAPGVYDAAMMLLVIIVSA